MPSLIVVESAGKQRFLSDLLRKSSLDGWTVVACNGHYCGLPKNSLGIDPKTLAFTWKVRNMQAFERMKKAVAAADAVYAATDSSPEGEAIANQVSITAGYASKPFHRLRLASLDVDSLRAALAAPTTLDQGLLQSFLAREAADRIVQFTLSPVLAERLGEGLQINRVSVPLLAELARTERRIRKFKAESFVVVRALLSDGSVAESKPLDAASAEEIVRRAKTAVPGFTSARELVEVPPPFTLSSLIQFASSRYGLDALVCARTCESLYAMGLITYPYTDSCWLSPEEAKKIHVYASEKLSSKLTAAEPVTFGSPSVLEAIRPVQIALAPSQLDLSGDLKTLYSAIWFRACGSQGRPAQVERQKCSYSIGDEEAFSADGLVLIEPGWHQLSGRLFAPVFHPIEPDCAVEEASAIEFGSKPPKRHTHGTLVAWLDAHFIGRPWVYRAALEFLQDQMYVDTLGGGLLRISPRGEAVLTFVRRAAKDLIDPDFCAETEEDIAAVERGHRTFEQFFHDQWQWAAEAASVMAKKSLRPKFTSPETGAKLKVFIDKESGRPYVRASGEEWWSFVSFDEKGRIVVAPESESA
jgi:DNA topoisomerase IA